MTGPATTAVTIYRLTKAQAETALRKMGVMGEHDPFFTIPESRRIDARTKTVTSAADYLRAQPQNAGVKLQYHALKWLKDADTETTIPLTEAEHAALLPVLGEPLTPQ